MKKVKMPLVTIIPTKIEKTLFQHDEEQKRVKTPLFHYYPGSSCGLLAGTLKTPKMVRFIPVLLLRQGAPF